MINHRGNYSKLCQLKNIYSMLDLVIKPKKPERFNSAINSSNKIKIPSHKRIKVKKLNVINRNKNNEKFNMDYVLDIVQRKNINKRIKLKSIFTTNIINSSAKNIGNNNVTKNAEIQTDKKDKISRVKLIPKENKYDYASKSIMEYRIKKYHQKQRNIYDITKSYSSIYKTAKNINFPNIYASSNSYRDQKIKDYLNISNNQKSKRNINIKRYYCILNNLRIKFHGNISLTRKSKDLKSIKNYKKKIGINHNKSILKSNNSSISMDKNKKYKNINSIEQMCSFSNKMIRDSLSDHQMIKIYENIKK